LFPLKTLLLKVKLMQIYRLKTYIWNQQA